MGTRCCGLRLLHLKSPECALPARDAYPPFFLERLSDDNGSRASGLAYPGPMVSGGELSDECTYLLTNTIPVGSVRILAH